MTVLGAVFGCCFLNYEMNCVLVCMRPGMAMNFGFHEVESMLDSGREQ